MSILSFFVVQRYIFFVICAFVRIVKIEIIEKILYLCPEKNGLFLTL